MNIHEITEALETQTKARMTSADGRVNYAGMAGSYEALIFCLMNENRDNLPLVQSWIAGRQSA